MTKKPHEEYPFFSGDNVPNIVLSALTTTIGIAAVKVPFDRMIQSLTADASLSLSQSFRSTLSLAAWRCLPNFVSNSMPRSYFCIYSKNSTKTKDTETHNKEHESMSAEESLIPKIENTVHKVTHIGNLAFVETSLAHYPDQKMAIDLRNIQYKANFLNWKKIYMAGYGLDFMTSVVGLTCLTHVNQYYQNKIIGEYQKASLSAGFMTGSLSGVTSAFITYPLKQIKTHVTLEATVQDGILHYPSTYSIFKKQLNDLKESPLKETLQSISKNLLMRSLSNALTFGVIIAINNQIGPKPYDDLKRKFMVN